MLFKELFLVLERYTFKILNIIKIKINPLSESFIGLTIFGTILTFLKRRIRCKNKENYFVFKKKPKRFRFFCK